MIDLLAAPGCLTPRQRSLLHISPINPTSPPKNNERPIEKNKRWQSSFKIVSAALRWQCHGTSRLHAEENRPRVTAVADSSLCCAFSCSPCSFLERILPVQSGLTPALDGLAPGGRIESPESTPESIDSSTMLFAAPKQKVSHSRRRLRQTHKWMKADKSVYRCPTCNAFKKRHIALHCARPEETCGLGASLALNYCDFGRNLCCRGIMPFALHACLRL